MIFQSTTKHPKHLTIFLFKKIVSKGLNIYNDTVYQLPVENLSHLIKTISLSILLYH